jgi:hypothetical protein
MKLFPPLFSVLLFAPALASAGALYGTVRTSRPTEGVSVMVACPPFNNAVEASGPVLVDPRGSFTLHVRTNGRCEMRAQSPRAVGTPFSVFSSSNSLRYDFQVDVKNKDLPPLQALAVYTNVGY